MLITYWLFFTGFESYLVEGEWIQIIVEIFSKVDPCSLDLQPYTSFRRHLQGS